MSKRNQRIALWRAHQTFLNILLNELRSCQMKLFKWLKTKKVELLSATPGRLFSIKQKTHAFAFFS